MIKYIVLALLIISILGLLIYGIPITDKQIRLEHKQFDQATVDGVIEYVNIKHHGNCFKLKNNSLEFVFYPITNKELNQDNSFGDIAKKGDKIYKASYSDTLILIKNKIVYKYKFKRMK